MPINQVVQRACGIASSSTRAIGVLAATITGLSVLGCSGQAALVSPTSPNLNVTASETVLSLTVAAASAPQHLGCPALGNPGGNSGMRFIGLTSVEEAVARSVAQITDAWYAAFGFVKQDFIAERLTAIAALDKNGDGLVCLAQTWGQDLNPNSHWALIYAELLSPPATERWAFADNHVGTSNK